MGAVGLATTSPWLIRNLAEVGNPVYPMLTNLLGGGGEWPFTEFNREAMGELMTDFRHASFSIHENILISLRKVVADQTGPWLFLFLPFYLVLFGRDFFRRGSRQGLVLLLILLNFGFLFFFMMWLIRYNHFLTGLILICCALALERICMRASWTRRLVLATGLLLFAVSLAGAMNQHRKAFLYLVHTPERDAYVMERMNFGDLTVWMNRNLPRNARVYTPYPDFYHSEPTLIYHLAINEYGGFASLESADAFFERLLDLNIDFVAYNLYWYEHVARPRLREGAGKRTLEFLGKYRDFVKELEQDGRLVPVERIRAFTVYRVDDGRGKTTRGDGNE
jgi:hypothetical protein